MAGQLLAIIGDPVSDEEVQVEAPFDGIIIGQSKLPLAHEGDALFNVAAFKSVSRAENRVEEFAAVHGT
jgi:predicted deacylase